MARAVPTSNLMAGLGDVPRHRAAHTAKSDESDFHCEPPRTNGARFAQTSDNWRSAAGVPHSRNLGRASRKEREHLARSFEPRFANLPVRDRRRKWRNKGEIQRFIASFSKTRLFFSKHFQRKLWRFCGISRGCKGSKSNRSNSKLLLRASLLSASFPTPSRRIPPTPAVRARGCSAVRRRSCCRRGGVTFMKAGSGLVVGEFELSTDSDLRKDKFDKLIWKIAHRFRGKTIPRPSKLTVFRGFRLPAGLLRQGFPAFRGNADVRLRRRRRRETIFRRRGRLQIEFAIASDGRVAGQARAHRVPIEPSLRFRRMRPRHEWRPNR